MRFLGCTTEQARARFGWRGLIDFLEHAPLGGEIVAEVAPQSSTRGADLQALELLASIFDGLAWLQYALLKRWGGHPQKPHPYPLKWREKGGKRYGRGAIPVLDFNKWYYGK